MLECGSETSCLGTGRRSVGFNSRETSGLVVSLTRERIGRGVSRLVGSTSLRGIQCETLTTS